MIRSAFIGGSEVLGLELLDDLLERRVTGHGQAVLLDELGGDTTGVLPVVYDQGAFLIGSDG